MSIGIWVFSLTFPCIYFEIGYFKYAFVFAILMIVVTFVTLVTSFFRIHSNVREHLSRNNIEPDNKSAESSRKMQEKRLEYENRVTKIFKSILAFYCICNIPACIFIFIVNLCETCDCYLIHWSRDLLLLCVLTNCAGNQFLYAWKMRSFIRAFRSLVHQPVSEASVVVYQSTNDA